MQYLEDLRVEHIIEQVLLDPKDQLRFGDDGCARDLEPVGHVLQLGNRFSLELCDVHWECGGEEKKKRGRGDVATPGLLAMAHVWRESNGEYPLL